MADYYSNKQDKVDFKQICLNHYKRILELSCIEFIGGYYDYTSSGNIVNKSYVTDKRSEFCQAVESLSLALFPHFDKKMTEDYNDYLNSNKALTKKYSNDKGFILSDKKTNFSISRLELMKSLFQKLGCLLFRMQYFKTSSYSEGDLDEEDVLDIDKQKEK